MYKFSATLVSNNLYSLEQYLLYGIIFLILVLGLECDFLEGGLKAIVCCLTWCNVEFLSNYHQI